MTTEYFAIYRQPLDQSVEEQIMRQCTDSPVTTTSEATLKHLEATCVAIYETDIRLFWFRNPSLLVELRFYDSVPIYIGRFESMPLSSFYSFQKSLKRQALLMNSAEHLQKELNNHRNDLKDLCNCIKDMYPPNIENDMVDILDKTHKIIRDHILAIFEKYKAFK